MSDTPRTDAFCNQWPDEIEPIMIPAIIKDTLVMASSFERELSDMTAQRDRLADALAVTWADIKHLGYWMPSPCLLKSESALEHIKPLSVE